MTRDMELSDERELKASAAVQVMPIRVQLSRRKGEHLPPGTVSVARPSRWGNPYVVGTPGVPDAAAAVAFFEQSIRGIWTPSLVAHLSDDDATRIYCIYVDHSPVDAVMRNKIDIIDFARSELRGRNLACWCALDKPCHADVLLRLSNE